MNNCYCYIPEHGDQRHQAGCIAGLNDTSELDALAEKIFISWTNDFQFKAEWAYTRAQEFLDYKKSRMEK